LVRGWTMVKDLRTTGIVARDSVRVGMRVMLLGWGPGVVLRRHDLPAQWECVGPMWDCLLDDGRTLAFSWGQMAVLAC
jgi:hypothetical protein